MARSGFILQRSLQMHLYDGFQGQDKRLSDRLRGWVGGSTSEMLVAWTQEVAAGRKRRGQIGDMFKEAGVEDKWT